MASSTNGFVAYPYEYEYEYLNDVLRGRSRDGYPIGCHKRTSDCVTWPLKSIDGMMSCRAMRNKACEHKCCTVGTGTSTGAVLYRTVIMSHLLSRKTFEN